MLKRFSDIKELYKNSGCCHGDCDVSLSLNHIGYISSTIWPEDSIYGTEKSTSREMTIILNDNYSLYTQNKTGHIVKANNQNSAVIHCECTTADPEIHLVNPPCRPYIVVQNGAVIESGCKLMTGCHGCKQTAVIKSNNNTDQLFFLQINKESPRFWTEDTVTGPIKNIDEWNRLPFLINGSEYIQTYFAKNARNTDNLVWAPFKFNGQKALIKISYNLVTNGMFYAPRSPSPSQITYSCFGCPRCNLGPVRVQQLDDGTEIMTIVCNSLCYLGQTCSLVYNEV